MNRRPLLILGLAFLLAGLAVAEKKGRLPPAPGTVFHFSPRAPSYVTCDVEFRDPTDTLWPNFFYGKPAADATFTFSPTTPKANFSLLCDNMAQKNGDQSRRVLGELVKDGKPPVVMFTVVSFGKLQMETIEVAGKGSKPGKKNLEYFPVEAVLDVGGKKLPVQGRAAFNYGYGKGSETPESVSFDIRFTVKGSDLGLRNMPRLIEARAGTIGHVKLDRKKK